MTIKIVVFVNCLAFLLISGCKLGVEEPMPEADPRDIHVGRYVCNVIKKNYNTQTILDSYTDTVDLVKQGQDNILIENVQNLQFPELKSLSPGSYVGIGTISRFEMNQLIITHGPDSAYYEFKGYKLE